MFIRYLDYEVFVFNDTFVSANQLIKIGNDSSGWRVYYKNEISNWIVFYPYSEYHGGGQSYVIKIGYKDFDIWINNNSNFENEIRQMIEK